MKAFSAIGPALVDGQNPRLGGRVQWTLAVEGSPLLLMGRASVLRRVYPHCDSQAQMTVGTLSDGEGVFSKMVEESDAEGAFSKMVEESECGNSLTCTGLRRHVWKLNLSDQCLCA